MPGFDKEIAKLAQRVLINPRKIDYHTGVLATKVTPGADPSFKRRLLRLQLFTRPVQDERAPANLLEPLL